MIVLLTAAKDRTSEPRCGIFNSAADKCRFGRRQPVGTTIWTPAACGYRVAVFSQPDGRQNRQRSSNAPRNECGSHTDCLLTAPLLCSVGRLGQKRRAKPAAHNTHSPKARSTRLHHFAKQCGQVGRRRPTLYRKTKTEYRKIEN